MMSFTIDMLGDFSKELDRMAQESEEREGKTRSDDEEHNGPRTGSPGQ
jgi:hypothetical protein